MSQQLAILIMIDVAAAIKAGNLEGNTYLIDNARWAGSTGEGTPDLITAVDGARASTQADPQVLNWLPYGIGDLPPSLPQAFFLTPADKKVISDSASLEPKDFSIRAAATPLLGIADIQNHPADSIGSENIPILTPKLMDITGALVGKSKAKTAPTQQFHPIPLITDITGEAVDKWVIFPAQYGSPDLFSDGLYWSATVDTNKVGVFAYTLHITLLNPHEKDGEVIWESVPLTFESYINVTNETVKNGFVKVPQLFPA